VVLRIDKFFAGIVFAALTSGLAFGQAASTASQALQLSAWGGITGSYVGINSGRNLSISAGGDATIRGFRGFFPSLEVRGTYPIDKGSVAGEKSVLGGLKFERHYGRVRPYTDVLFGRGELDYVQPLPNQAGTFFYIQTTSNVLSPGGGLDFALTRGLALKGDAQLQRWASPVTINGHFWAVPITVGAKYTFDFNHRYKRQR
jgi:hypothetical protein